MKKTKNFLCVVLIACALLFTGCASVSYSIYENANGAITQSIEVVLNKDYLASNGVNSSQYIEIKNYLSTTMEEMATSQKNNFENKIEEDSDLSSAQKKALKANYSYEIGEEDNNFYAIQSFSNIATYYYFYDIDPNDNSENNIKEIREDLFHSRYIQKTQTIFSNQDMVQSYVTIARTYLTSIGVPASVVASPQSYSYSYITTDTKLHSDSDEKTLTDNGAVIHTWNMSADETQREIVFYSIVPNRIIWYTFAILFVLVCIAGMFGYAWYRKKHPKEKKEIKDEEE